MPRILTEVEGFDDLDSEEQSPSSQTLEEEEQPRKGQGRQSRRKTTSAVPAMTSTDDQAQPVKKRRGRPPGSKNKPKPAGQAIEKQKKEKELVEEEEISEEGEAEEVISKDISDSDSDAAVDDSDEEFEVNKPKKRRGRPPGSKNKPKIIQPESDESDAQEDEHTEEPAPEDEPQFVEVTVLRDGQTPVTVPGSAFADIVEAYNVVRAFSWQLKLSPFSLQVRHGSNICAC